MHRLVFLVLAAMSTASTVSAQQLYWVCRGSISDQRGSTVLVVSKTFTAPAGMSNAQLTTGTPEWNKTVIAWQRYVLHKYSPAEARRLDDAGYFTRGYAQGPLGTCVAGLLANVQGQHDRDVKGGSVEQDWVYTPDQTPPASPQAAPAASTPIPSDPCNTLTEHRISSTPCSQPPATSYVMCSATDASPTAYVGATFQVTAVDTAKWTSAFGQFLAEKYGYKGAGLGCSVLHEDSSRTFLRGRILGLRANGKTVVETGWTYNSSPAVAVEPLPPAPAPNPVASSPQPAAPAPPAAMPAAAPVNRPATQPSTRYGICWASALTAPNTVYFSAPFESSAPNVQAWNKAYREVLRDRYQLRAINVHCSIHPSQDDAESVRNRVNTNSKVIETGWKSQ